MKIIVPIIIITIVIIVLYKNVYIYSIAKYVLYNITY